MSDTRARRSARLLVLPLFAGLALTTPAGTASAAPAPRAAAADSTWVPSPGTSTGTTGTGTGSTAGTSTAASAPQLTRAQRIAKQRAAKRARIIKLGRKVLRAAKTRKGSAYRYGGTGPRAFDCSGLTRWAYKKIGKKLPRTSGAQAGAVKRVKKPRLGDLVFFTSGGRVYHVGLYAGKHRIFHASRPGVPVGTSKIWSDSVFYGRPRY